MSGIIRIPVYRHVQRYLQIHHGEYIYSSDRNYASMLVRSMLKKFDKKEPWKQKPSNKLNLGATFDIVIGRTRLEQLGTYISNEDILKFSKTIDLLIRQEMYRWCRHPNATDHVIDFNIRRFLDFYNFPEDDLPFDNMKRWYFRERERIDKRLNPPIVEQYQLVFQF